MTALRILTHPVEFIRLSIGIARRLCESGGKCDVAFARRLLKLAGGGR